MVAINFVYKYSLNFSHFRNLILNAVKDRVWENIVNLNDTLESGALYEWRLDGLRAHLERIFR